MLTLVVILLCNNCGQVGIPPPAFQQFQYPEACLSAARSIKKVYYSGSRIIPAVWCVAADGTVLQPED